MNLKGVFLEKYLGKLMKIAEVKFEVIMPSVDFQKLEGYKLLFYPSWIISANYGNLSRG